MMPHRLSRHYYPHSPQPFEGGIAGKIIYQNGYPHTHMRTVRGKSSLYSPTVLLLLIVVALALIGACQRHVDLFHFGV